MYAWIRSAIILIATGFVGLVGAWQAETLVSARGAIGPTILQSIHPVSSLIAVVVTIGVGSIVGAGVSRISSTTTGMFVFGFSLLAMAMKLEGVTEFVFSGGNFHILIFESALLCVLVLLGTLVVFGIGGPTQCMPCDNTERGLAKFGKTLLISMAMLPVIWFIATTPAKGQVLGASALGGLLVGFLFRHFLHSSQPILLFALPIAIGGLGYLIGITVGQSDIAALNQQSISRLLLPMPLEYAAGTIIGIAIVPGWTSSVAENTGAVTRKKMLQ